MDLISALRPSSIAVVGASPRSFIGQVAVNNSHDHGFAGHIYPVGRHDRVAGLTCFPSLSELPEVPDVALIQLRAEAVLAIVEEGLSAGVRCFVIPGAGFTDSGEAANDLRDGLKKLRLEQDFTVVGPNCMGFIDLVTGAAPYVGTAPSFLRRGRVGAVAQSGAIIEAIVNAGGRVPLSTAISSGSEATTDFSEYIDFFAGDPHTDSVICFVEALGDPQAAIAATRRLTEAGKRLAVCVVGRSDTALEGIAAHSGKLASGAKVLDAAFRQAGAVIADDLDELLCFGEVFGTGRVPAGNRIHVVTNSGGEGSLLADLADSVGLELPPLSADATAALTQAWPRFLARNPLDPWGTDEYEVIYPEVLRRAASEPGDIVMLAADMQRTSGAREHKLGLDLAHYLANATAGTVKLPVMLSPTSQDPDESLATFCHQAGIALLRGARPALAALAKLADRERQPPRLPTADAEPASASRNAPDAALLGDSPLDEDGALTVLSGLGVTTPTRRRAATVEEVGALTRHFTGPMVLKAVAADLLHKSELGLVRTNLLTTEQVLAAAQTMRTAAGAHGLDVEFLLSDQIHGDLEVVVGYKRDAAFGPTVMVGSGGVWAEFLDDVALHVGPLDRAGAQRLLASSRVGSMIERARGGSLHAEGVISALCAVSDLGLANPDIVGIDINPLIVGRSHATAVDAVIERRRQPERNHR
jgi:acyl-CoA synthetase (NDP forming)